MTLVRNKEAVSLPYPGSQPYGGKYQVPQVVWYMNDDQAGYKLYTHAKIEGLIRFQNNPPKGTVIAKVDSFFSPEYTHSFACVTNGGFVRLQIDSGGEITVFQGEIKDYVFLDGIQFDHNPY